MRSGLHADAVAATSAEARRGRSVLERVIVAFPGLSRRISSVVLRSPRSRPQRDLVAWALRRTFAAFSRRDWEFNTLLLDRDRYEFIIGDPAGKAPGMKEHYQGIPGYLEAQATVLEIFTDMVVDYEHHGWAPDGRLVAGFRFRGRGEGSGVAVQGELLIAIEFARGLVVRHLYWWDPEAGLRSLGLEPSRR